MGARRPVSRVLFAPLARRATVIPLGRASLRASRDQPGRRGERNPRCRPTTGGPASAVPIRSCSRWGLPCRHRCRSRGALLPHRFALARNAAPVPSRPWPIRRNGRAVRAVCFLWHFPWGRPRRSLTGTVLPWSPDFPPSHARDMPENATATAQPSGPRVLRPDGGPGQAARRDDAPVGASRQIRAMPPNENREPGGPSPIRSLLPAMMYGGTGRL